MLSNPAGDQIPGESNLLLIMLTSHQSITLHLCNDSNPIKAFSDYFKHFSAHILMQYRKPQASKQTASMEEEHRSSFMPLPRGTAFWLTRHRQSA